MRSAPACGVGVPLAALVLGSMGVLITVGIASALKGLMVVVVVLAYLMVTGGGSTPGCRRWWKLNCHLRSDQLRSPCLDL